MNDYEIQTLCIRVQNRIKSIEPCKNEINCHLKPFFPFAMLFLHHLEFPVLANFYGVFHFSLFPLFSTSLPVTPAPPPNTYTFGLF